MQYADIAAAVLGAFVLAWLADLFTGRRGLFATSLVSGVAAVAGWFLAIRVFGVSTMDEWTWVLWSLAASALALVGFFLPAGLIMFFCGRVWDRFAGSPWKTALAKSLQMDQAGCFQANGLGTSYEASQTLAATGKTPGASFASERR